MKKKITLSFAMMLALSLPFSTSVQAKLSKGGKDAMITAGTVAIAGGIGSGIYKKVKGKKIDPVKEIDPDPKIDPIPDPVKKIDPDPKLDPIPKKFESDDEELKSTFYTKNRGNILQEVESDDEELNSTFYTKSKGNIGKEVDPVKAAASAESDLNADGESGHAAALGPKTEDTLKSEESKAEAFDPMAEHNVKDLGNIGKEVESDDEELNSTFYTKSKGNIGKEVDPVKAAASAESDLNVGGTSILDESTSSNIPTNSSKNDLIESQKNQINSDETKQNTSHSANTQNSQQKVDDNRNVEQGQVEGKNQNLSNKQDVAAENTHSNIENQENSTFEEKSNIAVGEENIVPEGGTSIAGGGSSEIPAKPHAKFEEDFEYVI